MKSPLVYDVKFSNDLLYHNKYFNLSCVRVINGYIHLPTWRTQGASYVARIEGRHEERVFKRKFINPTINLYIDDQRYPCGRKRRKGFRYKLPFPPGLYEIQRPAPYWYVNQYGLELARIYLAFYPDGMFEWLSRLDALCYVFGPTPELLKRYQKVCDRVSVIERSRKWLSENPS